jgi:DNA-directed RNA polymerase subunit RPC12/RpoP
MFSKNNESFICINCDKEVPEHPTSSRDHCIYCLYGLHVDIEPGDRKNECRGILAPIGLKISNGKEQIAYRCQICDKVVTCITAPDDNREKVVELSNLRWTE